MNFNIIKELSQELKITEEQINNTLKLLQENNTVPFIARYRKEVTRNLDEEQIRKISELYEYQVSLLKRKEDVIRLIAEKELLTEELKFEIMKCNKLVEVEDIYRPFKEKKKTKATEAIKHGLEPLANLILSFPLKLEVEDSYLNENVKTKEEAIIGAKYIIAEYISDNENFRKYIRSYIFNNGEIESKLKKNSNDLEKKYEMYYEYKEKIQFIKSHRILALNRGENENVLNVSLIVSKDTIIEYLKLKIIQSNNSDCINIVLEAIEDSYKRLIFPSIEREIRSELTEKASEDSISVFASNVENLLLQFPMKEKNVLGLDPAFRTGCKLAVIDSNSKFIEKSVIYPHEPHNDFENSKKEVVRLINKHNIDIIAIGNGTASRESESFIVKVLKDLDKKVEFIIVNEAGASVYSASKIAIEEFPDLSVEQRSAISIARRLQDPLAELVKIDPKSIGVGLYQHDLIEKRLNESLDFVVSKVVNRVGVNINTASVSLLKYVSGLNKKAIDKIIEYKSKKGKIKSRQELKKLLTDKTFEQSIGFMRIIDETNILDRTSIHPESYDKTLKLLKDLNLSLNDIGTNKIKEVLDSTDFSGFDIDKYTLEDIIKSLKEPLRDLRDDMPKPLLKSDVLSIEDLKVGMKLQGTIRNVVDFGLFIDIGLKNDGLAHISKLTNEYLKHPSEVFKVNQIVDCYVDEIFLDKKKVALSLKTP